ncbi:MAG: double-strand break repair protein AddB, partial [Xanthobacteraceae bacterium]
QILTDQDRIEPTERRDALIKAEAARLARKVDAPVIAAGSTGSIPSTADLIATIARLPHGAVVLPGLDTDLDETSWRLIAGDETRRIAPAPGHPQFAMAALLARIGIGRDAVVPLAVPHGRERLVSEALRPAAATDLWRMTAADPGFQAHADAALATMAVIEAANPEDEALAIAVALREAMHHGKTAALVTPDRALGRRVLAALQRWNIVAEDSGGDALADTPAGVFARLAAAAALDGTPPVTLLALLKHPLLRLGEPHAVAALERAILRGPRPRAGSNGLALALANFRIQLGKFRSGAPVDLHRSDPRTGITDSELAAAGDLVTQLGAALEPLEGLTRGAYPLSELSKRHREVMARLSHRGTEAVALPGRDGQKLAEALDELATSDAAAGLPVETSDYVELFSAALAGRVVRREPQPGLRVRILGPLEARLTDSDRVVLGGLVEGSWPPESSNDAWLSRPMRLALGLNLPERRIGLSAHDFAQLLGAPEVILSRAGKIAGAPTVASRFTQRLAAIAGERWRDAVERGETYLAWARELDRPERVTPAPQPTPTPPRAARPSSLSVTEIEDWLRDPYTIYARHVLRIRPLDGVDTEPGAAERGTIIHAAVGAFTQNFAAGLPADPLAELLALGEPHFAALEDFPEARAFWWPRFQRIAHWFTRWDAQRRDAIARLFAEIRGEIEIALSDGTFRLRGIADRIERDGAGGCVILDYKTGSVRSEKQVRTGLAPQLTLEAAMLRRGGFAGIPAGTSVSEIAYVKLKGGEPAGAYEPIKFKDGTADSQADRALERLGRIAQIFDSDTEPYRSLVHPMWRTRYGDYDHLARVKEWSRSGGEIDDIGGGE